MTGVTINADPALEMLTRIADAVADKKRTVMRRGAALMKAATTRAFSTRSDPTTGKRWPARRHSYPWPMLQNTGHLKSLLSFGYGVKMTKTTNPRLFGKVREGSFTGGYSRGGGGQAFGAQKPNIVVVGAVMYGRRFGRSVAHWRPKKRGGMEFHGGGSQQEGRAASTGNIPPRPLFGFSRSDSRQFARAWERAIKGAAA